VKVSSPLPAEALSRQSLPFGFRFYSNTPHGALKGGCVAKYRMVLGSLTSEEKPCTALSRQPSADGGGRAYYRV